jgi:hypothetical protein
MNDYLLQNPDQVNIPEPVGSDEGEVVSGLIGLSRQLDPSRKELPRIKGGF